MSESARTTPSRPLRVLHFVSGGFSGATQVAIDLCGDDEHQTTLLVLRRRIMNPHDRVQHMRARGLQVEVVPRWSHAVTIWRLWQLCRAWQPDVLVAHGFSEHLWGRYAGLLAGVPHLVQVEHNVRERYGHWRRWQSLWLAQRTDRLVGVSEAVRDALVRVGHPPERCTVVQNGIDLPRWQSGLPWHERENAIVMPARFARQKDHETLIRAMALLAAQGVRAKLYLAGEGKASWRAQAQRLIRQLGLEGQVECLGHVADLPSLLGRVKVCALSTHYEGLGLGLIEGMVSGCCAVGSDVEGVQEIITHGTTGLLVPPANPQAMADALARVLQNDAHAHTLARAGKAHAEQAFDRRRMRQDYLDLFLNLAKDREENGPQRPHRRA